MRAHAEIGHGISLYQRAAARQPLQTNEQAMQKRTEIAARRRLVRPVAFHQMAGERTRRNCALGLLRLFHNRRKSLNGDVN
jgi:hypothetical protein